MFFKDFVFFWDSGVPALRTESWLVLHSHGYSISLALV